MKIVRISINRPVTVAMGVLIAVILGWVSLTRLAIDLLPELNFPIAAVATSYEGAAPQEVETLVSRPLEEVMTTVGNVKSVSSMSTRGSAIVLVEFNWGTDMDFATLEMREKVDMIKPFLPDGVGNPRVLKFDPSQSPILQYGMGGSRSVAELRAIADDTVKTRLERLEGVASVQVTGGQPSQIHVSLDPGVMNALGISFDHIVQSLQAANLNLPAGQIYQGEFEVSVRTTGEFESIDDIGWVRIPAAQGSVLLKDIADIREGEADVEQRTRLNMRPSVGVSVLKETGANAVQVARAVHEAIHQLERELGDIEFVVVADEAQFVESSVQSVVQNALVGGALAILILLAFLRNARTTFIIATSIPISIIATFVLIYFADMTLNMLSLGGLALGIGMIVDNAIVVLESIFRHLQRGGDPKEAAYQGTTEVGMAILASTLTTVSVFLPVIFIEGLASQIFRDLSLTVSFSLLMSLVMALTVVPTMAARWLVRHRGAAQAASDDEGGSRLVGRLARAYANFMRKALKRRRWVFLSALAAMASAALIAANIGSEFIPAFDEGQIEISVELPKGTRLAMTESIVANIESHLIEMPQVETVFASAGSSDAPDQGQLVVRLVPAGQRQESTQAMIEEIRRFAAGIPEANIRVSSLSSFLGVGGLGGAPVQVEIRGDDLDLIHAVANDIRDLVRSVPGARDVVTSFEQGRPEIQVRVNRERAGALGVSVAQVASSLRTAVRGQTATALKTGADEIDIVVRLAERYRQDRTSLIQIPISTPMGMVPLGQVAELVDSTSPVSIDRTQQSRTALVNAHLADRDLGSVMRDIRAKIADFPLPAGVEIAYGGEDQQMNEAFGDLGLALVLAIVLVYAVLASQFESLSYPFAILFSVPFAFIGVAWGLFVSGHSLSVPAFVGVILTAGIVTNNAIILVDYANQLRARGMERNDALVEAGRVRLRPILMTTLTTVLAMLPLSLGIGEGSEIQAPMAVVVIGGLSVSTVLTLVVVPSVYTVMDDFTQWLRRIRLRSTMKGAA